MSVVSEDLGIDERIVELSSQHTCKPQISEGSWQVRCTPLIWHPVVEARVAQDSLVLGMRVPSTAMVAPRLTERRIAIPKDREVRFSQETVHVRSVEENHCGADTRERSVQVRLPSANIMPPIGPFGRTVFLSAGGDSPLLFARHRQYDMACKTKHGGEHDFSFSCGAEALSCGVHIEGELVHFDCAHPAAYSGAMLLPCGARGSVPADAFSTGEQYY